MPISIPRFKSIIFYLSSSKIRLVLQEKCKIFELWGLRPQTPKTAPPHCEILATRLTVFTRNQPEMKSKVLFYSSGFHQLFTIFISQ